MPHARTKKRSGWLVNIVFAAAVLGAFVVYTSIRRHSMEGEQAPNFTAAQLGGGEFSLADEPAKVIVLDFWASHCSTCLVSLPRLEQVHQWARQTSRPVAVYTVNRGEMPAQITDLWQRLGLTMPVLLDGDDSIARAYRVGAIPHTAIIAGGRVQRVHVGSISVDRLKRQVEGLLSSGQ